MGAPTRARIHAPSAVVVISTCDGKVRGHASDLDLVGTGLDFRGLAAINVARRHGKCRNEERQVNRLRLAGV